jgi:hypothetical protein
MAFFMLFSPMSTDLKPIAQSVPWMMAKPGTSRSTGTCGSENTRSPSKVYGSAAVSSCRQDNDIVPERDMKAVPFGTTGVEKFCRSAGRGGCGIPKKDK